MGIRESALSTLSALTNNDFIRMVSSAGASRKATLQAIAQHIIEQYAGSTLLGRQQSVQSALSELNSTLKTYKITDIVDTVKAVYTGLTADSRIVHVDYGYMCCIIFKIKTTAISSGTVSLPSTIPSCRIETQAALSSTGNHGGFAQLTGRTLVLRCAAETAQYLCGCLVYIP